MNSLMKDNSLISSILEHKIQNGTIVAGATAAGTPTQTMVQMTGGLGTWTSTHGVGALTYIEIFQMIGALGVLLASLNIIINWIKAFRARK